MGWDTDYDMGSADSMQYDENWNATTGGFNQDDLANINASDNWGQPWMPENLSAGSSDFNGSTDWLNSGMGSMFDNPNTNVMNPDRGTDMGFQQFDDWGAGANLAPPQDLDGSAKDYLNKLFGGLGNNPDKVMKGLAALYETSQNKKKASAYQNIANKPVFDPFGSQRPMYQQELARAMQDPYSSPMVRAQVDQIQQAQDRKDAAAGRRSNSVGSAPAVLAAQGKVAQDYMQGLYQPAGANINPAQSQLAELYKMSAQAGTQGMSPLFSAYGSMSQQDQAAQQQQKLLEALIKSGRV